MKECLFLVLVLVPNVALADFTLKDLTGNWVGEGSYHEGLSSAKMKCKLTATQLGANVQMTGRCASSLGSQKVDMVFTAITQDAVQLTAGPNAPKVDTEIDEIFGQITGEQLFLTGQAGKETFKMQFVNNSDGTLYFATERVWDKGKSHSKITLTSR